MRAASSALSVGMLGAVYPNLDFDYGLLAAFPKDSLLFRFFLRGYVRQIEPLPTFENGVLLRQLSGKIDRSTDSLRRGFSCI